MKKSSVIFIVFALAVVVGLTTWYFRQPKKVVTSPTPIGATEKPFNDNWWAEVTNDPNVMITAEAYLNEKILDGTVSGEVTASSFQEMRYRGFEKLNQILNAEEKSKPMTEIIREVIVTDDTLEAKEKTELLGKTENMLGAGSDTLGTLLNKIDNLNY